MKLRLRNHSPKTVNFFYSRDGSEVVGPITQSELERLSSTGILGTGTMICAEGSEEWRPLEISIAPVVQEAQPHTYLISEGGVAKGRYARSQIRSMWKSGALTAEAKIFDAVGDRWVPVSEVVQSFAFSEFFSKFGLDTNSAPNQPLVTATEAKIADERSANKGCAMLAAPAAIFLLFIGGLAFHSAVTKRTVTELVDVKVDIRPWAEPKNKPSLVELVYNPEEAAERYRRDKLAAQFPLREVYKTRPKNSGDFLIEWLIGSIAILGGLKLFAYSEKCRKAARAAKEPSKSPDH